MLIPQNSYIAGNPLGGNTAFMGRTDVLREVTRVLGVSQATGVVSCANCEEKTLDKSFAG